MGAINIVPPKFCAVRGYMRSGTNWICNLLNLHPGVSCVGEFHWQRVAEALRSNLLTFDNDVDLPKLRETARESLQKMIRELMIAANRRGTAWIGDRTPAMIDLELLPDARYFDVVRDGRDVLVSRAFHVFRLPESLPLFDTEPDLARTLDEYQADRQLFFKRPEKLLANKRLVMSTVRQWNRFVSHNEAVARNNQNASVLRIRYEDVHQDTQAVRTQMYEFLDLDPQEAAELTDRTSAGFDKERPRNLYRKGIIGDWRNYFDEQTRAWFLQVAPETLQSLGYTQNNDW